MEGHASSGEDSGPSSPDEPGDGLGIKQQKTIVAPVFWPAAALILTAVAISFIAPKKLGSAFDAVQSVFSTDFGWIYILAANFFLVFAVWLIFSRHASVRLGGPDAKPEFSTPSWFAMLFSAGMGIGLVFWSVAEPIDHFAKPPLGAAPMSVQAARDAMAITFFHWGLHAWAIYGVIALALAYFSFNRGLPLTIRSTFYPLLGERIHGPIGHVIDVLAILATLFGLATSLGLGAQQINAGLDRLLGVGISPAVQVVLIVLITGAATASVVSGLDKGIRLLSEINMCVAAALMAFVFVLGSTVFLLDALVQNFGAYVEHLLDLGTWAEAYTGKHWQHKWTIFYWSWWIAWSPFVGMFIARISKGRTIREFMTGVLLVPTLLTGAWLTIFGSSALHEQMYGGGGILEAVNTNVATALFALLETFPLSSVTSALAVFVIITFFVTSSDSGSLVIDTISSGGHPNPPVIQKVFWACLEGVVAIALLLAGGLSALQAGTVLTGLPFTFVLLMMCYSLSRALARETDGVAQIAERKV